MLERTIQIKRRLSTFQMIALGFAGVILLGALLLTLPINAIVHHLTGIMTLNAVLPWKGAVLLVGISIVLTVVAGLIPAKIAARKDPVEALRSE